MTSKLTGIQTIYDGHPATPEETKSIAFIFMVALQIAANEKGLKHAREHYERWYEEAKTRVAEANLVMAMFDAEFGSHPR